MTGEYASIPRRSRDRAPRAGLPASSIRGFLLQVRELAEAELPSHLRDFQARLRFNFLQIHYGDPHVHYEVWPQRRTGRIEIGLHLEGERQHNERLAALLAAHAEPILAALGPDIELEQWTESWIRLHYALPFSRPDEATARAAAHRLAALIEAVEPILAAGPAGPGA